MSRELSNLWSCVLHKLLPYLGRPCALSVQVPSSRLHTLKRRAPPRAFYRCLGLFRAVAASVTRHELLEAQCDSLLRSIKIAQTISNHLSSIANDLDVRNMALSREKADMRDAICTLKLSLQSERRSERQLADALEDVNGAIVRTKRLASDLLDHASNFFCYEPVP
ncbi:hypothetical protein H1R20_g11634, partial [Candolleomyces eurysporus]